VEAGTTKVILGASGSGKSTLLRLMMGFYLPNSGRVLIDGEDTARMSAQQLREMRKTFGMVFQEGALFDSMTVGENVGYALFEERRHDPADIEARVRDILNFLGLGEQLIDRMPDQLSGGMQRRVAVGRAIAAHNPRFMLYDEPTTGLDPLTVDTITELITKLQREKGVTSVMVTHELIDALKVGIRSWCSTRARSCSMARTRSCGRARSLTWCSTWRRSAGRSRSTPWCKDGRQKRGDEANGSGEMGELKVGLLVAVGIAFLLWASFSGSGTSIFYGKRPLHTVLNTANGLIAGAPVRLAGVEVGKVEEIKLIGKSPTDQVFVTLLIEDRVWFNVKADSKATLGTIGMLGDKYIEVSPGSPELPELKPGDFIEGHVAGDLLSLVDRAPEIVGNLEHLAQALGDLARKLEGSEGTLGKLIHSDSLYNALTQASRQAASLVGDSTSGCRLWWTRRDRPWMNSRVWPAASRTRPARSAGS